MNSSKKVFVLFPKKGNLPDGSAQHWSEVTASSLIGLDESGNVVEEGKLVGLIIVFSHSLTLSNMNSLIMSYIVVNLYSGNNLSTLSL